MLAIPKPMLDALDLAADAAVGLTVRSGKLVVEPQPRQHYSLNELLAQCDASAPAARDDHDWLESPPKGREII